MKTKALALAAAATILAACQESDKVDILMSQMTTEEKIGQLNLLPGGDITTGAVMNSPLAEKVKAGELGAVLNVKGVDKIRELQRVAVEESRLGIPLLFGQDVIHGYETVFPLPFAQACSWDTALVRLSASVAANEATATGINWVYSPMVDVNTDPRWGRASEGAGEDPFLAGEMGAAMISGYQGDWGARNAMACLKHFALYGASEAGRDYNMVDMSRVRMYNQYFAPYKRCAEAGAGSVMTSFNLVEGIPATGNKWLVDDVLRGEWGFDGFVVTDYGSINEMGVYGVGDQQSNAAQALRAGTDMDMCSEAFVAQLKKCLDEGRVTMEDIDRACRRVLKAKERLGLLDDPYRFCDTVREKGDLYTTANRSIARQMATESFVLLKNEGGILPLKAEGTIALIGPLANTRNNLPGSWSTGDDVEKYSTLLEVMRRRTEGKATILYAQGSNIYDSEEQQKEVEFGRPIERVDKEAALTEAINVAKRADVVVLALGEMAEMSGECASRSDLTMPDAEMDLMKAIAWTGKPVVLLNYSGRPTVLTWENENVSAIMNVWFAGSETGDAVCDVLFGDVCPSGKLVASMPQSVGQLPLYYNHTMTGRPVPDGADRFYKYLSNYMDVRNDPLYPFGYGLSYTTFDYSDISLSKSEMRDGETITASVTVTNSGQRDADEVVQLYLRDVSASIARPVKELKGFRRIHLKAGESQTVSFEITRPMLEFYNNDLKLVAEPGEFVAMTGPDSQRVSAASFTYRK
ncbi:MAG: beta-glucosidase BglX [Marinilabiliaceae bacterium]